MTHRNQRRQKSLRGFNSLLLGKFDSAADTVTAGSSLVFLSFVLWLSSQSKALRRHSVSPENGPCGIVSRLDAVGLKDMKRSHRVVLRETQQNETEEKSREQSARMLSSFNWSR